MHVNHVADHELCFGKLLLSSGYMRSVRIHVLEYILAYIEQQESQICTR